jgi:urease accessory protein
MLRVARRVSQGTPSDVLSLPYDERKKSRLRVRSEGGQEVGIVLERGSSLRDGDLLAADGGEILIVRAARESVSEVRSGDELLLMRAAYHLGNRHVPLQIEVGGLRYQHDHVLDAMVRELGLEVVTGTAAFEPEGGAYGRGAGGDGHVHIHAHGEDADERVVHAHGDGEHSPAHEPDPQQRDHSHPHTHRARGGDR